MTKKINFCILLVVGLALAACSSDDNVVEQKTLEPGKTYYLTVDATKGANEAASSAYRRALTLSGSTLNASWATSEHVFVQGTLSSNSSNFWYKGSIQPQTAGTTTRLNGAITVPDGWVYSSIQEAISNNVINYPLEIVLQFPRSGNLDYTGQKGTLSDIAANYDYAIATDAKFNVDGNNIIGIQSATFENQQAIVKFTLTNGTNPINPTTLTINYSSGNVSLTDIPEATYTTNGNGVLYVALPGFSGQNVTLTATCSSGTYTYTKSGRTFENGKYYQIGVNMTKQ